MKRRHWLRTIGLTTSGLLAGGVLYGQSPDRSTARNEKPEPAPQGQKLEYPLIAGHGGIVPIPGGVEPPTAGTKLILDIVSDSLAGGVVKGLDRAALFCNLYAAANLLPGKDWEVALVLHGPATKAALTDQAYAQYGFASEQGPPRNPNLPLLTRLREAGVELLVCGQAVSYKGFQRKEIDPMVKIAISAALVNINKQAAGYAYLPFH